MDTSGGGPYTDIQESGTRHLPPSIPEKCNYQKYILPINLYAFFTTKVQTNQFTNY